VTADGLAEVKVIAGEALGAKAVIDTHTPIVYQDWTLRPGADVSFELGRDHEAMVYVFEGSLALGDTGTEVRDGQLALLDAGDVVRLRGPGTGTARALVLAGVPLREPVARYGPFVMNTHDEIRAAFTDFQSGKMGEITRTART
jgi:redox-sensitive bicupin YhaK (pirin superfamily)